MIKKLKSFISDVDFEMKKVSWPTWEELRGSTYVVLTLTFIMGLYLFFSFPDITLNEYQSIIVKHLKFLIVLNPQKRDKDPK